jgi:enediyne biosynthesis protein E3
VFTSIRKTLFKIPTTKASFGARGFEACDSEVKVRLERIIEIFLEGYNLTLEREKPELLAAELDAAYDAHHVGFAYEGTGLYYGMADLLFPRNRSRLQQFVEGTARKHDFIVTVGAGFSIARVPWGIRSMFGLMQKLDPMIAWCVPDGYGFHQGFFQHRRYIDRCEPPPSELPTYARQLFDSGLGRSLWWVKGGDPNKIKMAIDQFAEPRRGELWCGVGVAAAYAGGVDTECLNQLRDLSGSFRADYLCGIPFATRMRQKGGNPSAWTETACRLLLGATAEEVSDRAMRRVDALFADWAASEDELRRQAYRLVRDQLRLEFSRPRRAEIDLVRT